MRSTALGVKHLVYASAALAALLGSTPTLRAEDRLLRLDDLPWQVGTPNERPKRVEEESGPGDQVKIRVERIWREGQRTHATVTLRNISRFEFRDVLLRCQAFDSSAKEIGAGQQALTPERYDAMRPGFAAKLEFTFDTPDVEVRSLSCIAQVRGFPRRAD